MAAPSYSHDLTDWIIDSDTTAWTELTNAISGGAPDEADTESALQGTNTVSQAANTTGLCSMIRILGTPVTFSAGQVALVWHGHGVATALQTYANNGLRVAFSGNAVGDWKSYTVGGNDVPPFPYGKWVNNAVDPSLTADATNGTPPSGGTSIYGIGSMCQQTAVIAKGQPHVCDIIRYGRAEARINGGDLANGYATFSGFAAANDAQTARWGLIQQVTGGYQWKGLMTLGYSSAVDFRDSNTNVFIQDCRKVSSTFNKIEIRQAGSRVDWTGINFINASPSTNASKGALEFIDDATGNITSCSFTDMDTFAFLSNSTINSTIFRRCGQVTVGGGTFTNCTFDKSTASSAALAASPAHAANISNCSFVSDGSGHGLEVTGTAANFTLTNVDFTGYSGTSTDAAVFVNIGTGTVNITIDGGTNITGNVRTAGATINVITGSVTLTIAGSVTLSGAEVRIYDLDNSPAGSLGTELAGSESNAGATFAFSDTIGNEIWIQILKDGYEEFGQAVTMPSANATFTAILKPDINA